MVNCNILQIIFATKLVILATNISLITGGYFFEMHLTCVFETVTIESVVCRVFISGRFFLVHFQINLSQFKKSNIFCKAPHFESS